MVKPTKDQVYHALTSEFREAPQIRNTLMGQLGLSSLSWRNSFSYLARGQLPTIDTGHVRAHLQTLVSEGLAERSTVTKESVEGHRYNDFAYRAKTSS